MTTERTLRIQAEAAKKILEALGLDDDELKADTIEGETDLLETIDRALDDIDECEAFEVGLKQKEEQFKARRERFARRKESLKASIEMAMSMIDEKTIRRPSATITLRELGQKLVIEDESLIPSQYFKIPEPPAPKLDKKAVTDALKGDTEIPGARLDNGGLSITIRKV